MSSEEPPKTEEETPEEETAAAVGGDEGETAKEEESSAHFEPVVRCAFLVVFFSAVFSALSVDSVFLAFGAAFFASFLSVVTSSAFT